MLATPKVGIWEHSKCKLYSIVTEHENKKMWYGQLLILKISIVKVSQKKKKKISIVKKNPQHYPKS